MSASYEDASLACIDALRTLLKFDLAMRLRSLSVNASHVSVSDSKVSDNAIVSGVVLKLLRKVCHFPSSEYNGKSLTTSRLIYAISYASKKPSSLPG